MCVFVCVFTEGLMLIIHSFLSDSSYNRKDAENVAIAIVIITLLGWSSLSSAEHCDNSEK